MAKTPSDRSVRVGSIIGSQVVTGDRNASTLHVGEITMPPSSTVDPLAEIRALKARLIALEGPEAGMVPRALADAEEQAAKPEGERDKNEIGGALDRAVKFAKKGADFSKQIEEMKPHLAALYSWIGRSAEELGRLLS